jgi:hypothetical protein
LAFAPFVSVSLFCWVVSTHPDREPARTRQSAIASTTFFLSISSVDCPRSDLSLSLDAV